MGVISSKTQPQQQRNKVGNILIRYCGGKYRSFDLPYRNYQHPENAYLVKYFPKYYHGLSINMTHHNPLLSKIKRIKKLKRFTGNFDDQTPQVDWFKILGNNRKEIEEFPRIIISNARRLFWAKASLHAARFFFLITKLQLPIYPRSKEFFLIWKAFSQLLRNMRRLKILEIKDNDDPNLIKLLFNKLNGMTRLLGKLEEFKSTLASDSSNDILQHQNVFTKLTNLNYDSVSPEVTPVCQAIPQVCKNLKLFSLQFIAPLQQPLLKHFQFHAFITPIQELPKLQSISITWPRGYALKFWSSFVPPRSLRNLELNFLQADLTTFRDSAEKDNNLFGHWKEINELDVLDLHIRCAHEEGMRFCQDFTTGMLKKISRLISFQCDINLAYDAIWIYEPFEIKEVPHLYEYLKKFKVLFHLEDKLGCLAFDFDFLKPFQNLKEIDFQGSPCDWANIGDVIRLSEKNIKIGEFPTLKLGQPTIWNSEKLKDLLMKISNAKNSEANLKIVLAVEFKTELWNSNAIKYLDQFCGIIESKNIKGLEILLNIQNLDYPKDTNETIAEIKRVLGSYPGMRNFTLKYRGEKSFLYFLKIDGEKEQLLYYRYP